MEIFIICLLFALGIVLIVKGGDWFVDAAGWIAEVSGIPKFVIGATIVSLATTLPELLVSLFATIESVTATDPAIIAADRAIAAGNAIGSVTANIGLIMAISIIFMPGKVPRRQFAPKAAMMIAACLILVIFSRGCSLGMLPSVLLIIIFAVFITENVISAKRGSDPAVVELADTGKPTKRVVTVNILKFIFGAAGIVIGAQLLVDYGKQLATLIGVPEEIIAVTMIAIGTSLPELVTTITAIAKKESSMSIGNIVGANILDLTMILSVCSFVSGGTLEVPAQTVNIDLWACLAVGAIAVVPTVITQRLRRWQGFALLGIYVAYVVYICVV